MRLVLRLILMGIGLGVLTGSALKVLAPQVRNQQISLPEWIGSQAWLSGLTPDEDNPGTASAEPLRSRDGAVGLPLGRFEPKQEITSPFGEMETAGGSAEGSQDQRLHADPG